MFSQPTKALSKLVIYIHTELISLTKSYIALGNLSFKILKWYPLPILLSTWMHNSAILLVFSTYWHLHSNRGGTFTRIHLATTISWISNPLSAIIVSPGSSISNRPDRSVIFLSDILPPHASDTMLTSPVGVHPITRCYDFYVANMLLRNWAIQMVSDTQSHSSL